MEMSHRGKSFITIHEEAIKDIRELLAIPTNFKIFFFSGGASLQFTAIPMNLLKKHKKANYLVTGAWSEAAATEAKKYGSVNEVTPKAKAFQTLPDPSTWTVAEDADYFHYCENETVHGVEINGFPFDKIPAGQTVVCDMSSNFCSREIDWTRYGVVYAGIQKNLGPAGVCVVVAREDLLDWEMEKTPLMCSWKTMLKAPQTYHNTPVCWSIYVMGLNLKYMKEKGMAKIKEEAKARSELLYSTIDNSGGYFSNPVALPYRSRMNVPFRICKNDKLEAKFLKEASERHLTDLGGHRSVGGCRASIYNAMPLEGVKALTDFMKEFQKANPEAKL